MIDPENMERIMQDGSTGENLADIDQITSLSFSLTSNCNLHCSFCPRTRYGVAERLINPAVMRSIVSFGKKIERVQILGLGEPLIFSGFCGVVKDLKNTGVHLSFTTNGLLLKEDMCRELCRNKVDEVIISLQGAQPNTHEEGKDSKLEVLLGNVKRFAEIKRMIGSQKPCIAFNFVGLKGNIAELSTVVRIAKEVGADRVYVANVVPFDRETSSLHIHRNSDYASHYIDIARKKASELGVGLIIYASLSPSPIACRWSTRPHIGLEGDVYPCNFIGAQEGIKSNETIWYEDVSIEIDVSSFRLGNVLKQDLEKIWNSRKSKELRAISMRALEKDLDVEWGREQYRNLILQYRSRPLTPEDVCRICPHRFKITH